MKTKKAMFFSDINEVPTQYPWLSFEESCEVLVIGGGVSGCFAAHELALAGIDTVLISARPIGYSNCAIDSSALNYQNELMLTNLVSSVGREKAITYFNKCSEAFNYVKDLAESMDFDFCLRDSLVYTNAPNKINDLHSEYLMRKHNGYSAEFIEKSAARERYSFELTAGILSKNSGGELDCYKLCHALLKKAEENSARIYENTTACTMLNDGSESGITIETDNKKKIKAKKVMFATGYNQDCCLGSLTGKKRSYFIATAPVDAFSGLENRELVKNIDTNINLRTTKDNRIIVSGLDNSTVDKDGKIAGILSIEKLLTRKYEQLYYELTAMLCGVNPLITEYEYNGIYGVTKDSLPIIGAHKDFLNVFFDMPASINGVLDSVIAAQIITDTVKGENVCNIFAPDR